MTLYRRHMAGETIEQLAAEFQIPEDRIAVRIRAASAYVRGQTASADVAAIAAVAPPTPEA